MQCSSADTADNDSIDMMPAKARDRIACAVLVYLVAVADRLKLSCCYIDNHKLRG